MAQSIKKRISGVKSKSRKSQLKFSKRIAENYKVLNQIKNQLN